MSIFYRRWMLAASFLMLSLPAQALDRSAAETLVRAAADDALSSFAGKTLDPQTRKRLFQAEIRQFSDLNIVSADILGKAWGRFSEDETTEFRTLLLDYIAAVWGATVSDIALGTRVEVKGVEAVGSRLTVHAAVLDPSDPPTTVDLTVGENAEGKPVLVDLSSDGVSIVTTMRADFAAVLRANGGRAEALFQAMRQKIIAGA